MRVWPGKAKAIGRDIRWCDEMFGYKVGDAAADLSFDERDDAHAAPLAVVIDPAAVELLPVYHRMDDRHLVERKLCNYWGYNTLAFFAPDQRCSSSPEADDTVTPDDSGKPQRRRSRPYAACRFPRDSRESRPGRRAV